MTLEHTLFTPHYFGYLTGSDDYTAVNPTPLNAQVRSTQHVTDLASRFPSNIYFVSDELAEAEFPEPPANPWEINGRNVLKVTHEDHPSLYLSRRDAEDLAVALVRALGLKQVTA